MENLSQNSEKKSLFFHLNAKFADEEKKDHFKSLTRRRAPITLILKQRKS